jgi:hypothetical protein
LFVSFEIMYRAAIVSVAHGWNMPEFSWETLPVAFHSSNPPGAYSDEQLSNMSKFSTVTFEKWQGLHHYLTPGYDWETCQNGTDVSKCGCCVEDEMADMGRRLKAMKPSIMVLEYLNSQQVYPHYRLGHAIAARPDLWARDTDGNIVLSGGGHWVWPDLAQQEAQDIWYNSVFNLTQTGDIDGLFVDGCVKGGVGGTTKERQVGKTAMLRRLQADIPGPVICGSNGAVEDGLGGSQIQNWGKGGHWSTREIPMLQRAVQAGALFQAHGSCPSNMSNPKTINDLAAFLIAAGPYSYYVCGGWNSAPTTWFEVYDRPLGAPVADAVLSADGVWSRSFAHGVSVTFDTNTETGVIDWSNEVAV